MGMQKVIHIDEIEKYSDSIDERVLSHINEGLVDTFECFDDFTFIAIDWYDVFDMDNTETSKIIIYLDKNDLFFMAEDERSFRLISEKYDECESNENALYRFFVNLLANNTAFFDDFEQEITENENEALMNTKMDYLTKIVKYRKELIRLKKYYDRLDTVMDNMAANDNDILTDAGVRHMNVLANRTERYKSSVASLRDYVTQMREAYQAQVDIEQNNIMKFFTLITAIFLPLTLMVGWYGMNFSSMPELASEYGYPIFVAASAAIVIALLVYFKKKKWS